MKSYACMTGVLSALVLFAGCRKQPVETAMAESLPEELFAAIEMAVSEGQESGAWDEAIVAIRGGFGDPAMEVYRTDLFRHLLLAEMASGNTNEAISLLVQHASDGQLCGVGFNMIGEAFARDGAMAQQAAWAESLLDTDAPDWVKERAWAVIVQHASRTATLPALPERLDAMLAAPSGSRMAIAGMATRALLSARDYETLNLFLSELEAKGAELPWIRPFLVEVKLDSLLGQERLADAKEFVLSHGSEMGDGALWQRVSRLLAGLEQAEDGGYDAFVRELFVRLPERPSTLGRAAGQWVHVAVKRARSDLFVGRMDEILAVAAIPADRKSFCFQRGFYDITPRASAAQRRELGRIADALYALSGLSDSERGSLALVRLDTAFYTDDWRRALAILDEGVPEKDATWHEHLKTKVGAHLALHERRFEDAIAGFRKHMAVVAAWEEDMPNPEANTMTSKESVLGFNEKRIGDIYKAMGGKDAEAAAAYARARDYYLVALGKLEKGTKAYELATAEMAAVPGGDAGGGQ